MKAHSFCCIFVLWIFTGETLGEDNPDYNIQEYICNQKFTGWTLDYSQRHCQEETTTACVDPFPYKTKHECLQDFRGLGNICDRSPCLHGGACLPVTTYNRDRTYKCDCSATGYYGARCQRRCPSFLSKRHSKQTACIKI